MKKNNDERSGDHDQKKKQTMMKKKNISRLGGRGLSLGAFANAKSKSSQYNPALIKKQREFYKNAKNVKKFKKLLKQQNDSSVDQKPIENLNETEGVKDNNERKGKRRRKDSAFSLEEIYKKTYEEKEKERMEREAVLKEKKEQREKAEARRKAMREIMFKKTRKGQPVMKYRIEHLLETIIQGNKS